MKGVFILIKEPYIGMPIIMGGRCDTVPANPGKPPQSQSLNPNSGMSGGASNGASGSGGASGSTGSTSASGTESGSGDANASGFDAMYLGSLPIAMSYTPMQQWKTTYSLEKGLTRGTIFPELDLPFEGRTLLSEQAKGGRN